VTHDLPSVDPRHGPHGQDGFTLIELIMVIVMLGVLAVFAAPRIFNTGDFSARGFHDETMSLLRFAQKTAIAQRRTVCVALNDKGVILTMDTNAAAPDGTCDAALLTPNVPRGGGRLSASVAKFEYRALGDTNLANNISIAISNAEPITIQAATGYVHN
jgi:MSHA pilin protein MshC